VVLNVAKRIDGAGFKGEGVRYGIASALSTVLTLLLPVILTEIFELAANISVGISLSAAFMFNFIVIRFYVFRSAGSPLLELIKFALTSGAFRLAEYLAFYIFYDALDCNYLIVLIGVLLCSFCIKFFVQRIYVFSNRA
jgi:putative flippase GtrA